MNCISWTTFHSRILYLINRSSYHWQSCHPSWSGEGLGHGNLRWRYHWPHLCMATTNTQSNPHKATRLRTRRFLHRVCTEGWRCNATRWLVTWRSMEADCTEHAMQPHYMATSLKVKLLYCNAIENYTFSYFCIGCFIHAQAHITHETWLSMELRSDCKCTAGVL